MNEIDVKVMSWIIYTHCAMVQHTIRMHAKSQASGPDNSQNELEGLF